MLDTPVSISLAVSTVLGITDVSEVLEMVVDEMLDVVTELTPVTLLSLLVSVSFSVIVACSSNVGTKSCTDFSNLILSSSSLFW